MEDVIAAVVTGAVQSGVGVIRVSGPGAAEICDRVVRIRVPSLKNAEPRHMYYGSLEENGKKLDEALIVYMPAPHSYTAEDTVELQCHGGPYLLQQVLEAVLRAGARLAEPGEFTKRAFLNGRLDLTQAEAVMGLISSENAFARECSLRQLCGETSGQIRQVRETILEKTAFIEAALDDPEHYSLDGLPEELDGTLSGLRSRLREWIDGADDGRRLSDGIPTAIIGRPNVGKSSLLNALLGEERAIVTSVPGTTRDTLEEKLRLGDLLLLISDTAGIRESEDEAERIGIERAFRKAEESELVLYVLDGSSPLSEEDEALMHRLQGRRCLLLVNKTDLPRAFDPAELEKKTGVRTLCISAREKTGLKELQKEIEALFRFGEIRQKEILITDLRHKKLLEAADAALGRVQESIAAGMPEDFYSIDLMDAYRSLGLILGEEVEEDLVNEIFGKFCMGK